MISFHVATNKGITLIEAVVSVAILSVALAGPLSLAAHSLKASGAAREEMIATHLAEEGLEVVHSLRDNTSADDATAAKTSWMQGVFANCAIGASCVVDVTEHSALNVWNSNALVSCPGGGCGSMSKVYLNPATGLYRQFNSVSSPGSPWTVTAFDRTVTVTGVDDALNPQREVNVVSTVTYPGYGGMPRSISISEHLYNWFPYLH